MKIIAFHGTAVNFDKFQLNKQTKNVVYGGAPDNGLGIFFTNNEIMAKWFGGGIVYSPDVDGYIFNKKCFLFVASLTLNKTLHFRNENEKFEDSYQQYFEFISKIGGTEQCRKMLLSAGYDSIIIHDATTNYYVDGSYNAYVILNTENIEIIKTEIISSDIDNNKIISLNQKQQNTNGQLYTTETYNPESRIDFIPTFNTVPMNESQEVEIKHPALVNLKKQIDSCLDTVRYNSYLIDNINEYDKIAKQYLKQAKEKKFKNELIEQIVYIISYIEVKKKFVKNKLRESKEMEKLLKLHGHSTSYLDKKLK